MSKFDESTITDQKRLVRGEQLLQARTCLRERDEVHHRRWRVMIMAGGAPAGEIAAIRELMPKAHIVAVDKNRECLLAAAAAGADQVVECDLTEWELIQSGYSQTKKPNRCIAEMDRFDILHLDLCAGANEISRRIIHIYKPMVTARGVLITTFSYGRDVVEMFNAAHEMVKNRADGDDEYLDIYERLLRAKIPELVLGRILYLCPGQQWLSSLRSVMSYRGREMPMCSLLFSFGKPTQDVSFVQVEPGDFELAVTYPDSVNLYDCPQERIDGLRRRFAAIKASLTRISRASSEEEFTLRP